MSSEQTDGAKGTDGVAIRPQSTPTPPSGDLAAAVGAALAGVSPGGAKRPTALARGPRSVIRFGWLALLIGFFGFFVWSAFAPLDSGVTATGSIVVDSSRQKVQHLTGGIIEEVLVRDGSEVAQGDVLMRLNRTRTQAELSIVQAQLLSSLAIEARLIAERDRAQALQMPEQVAAAARTDSRVAEVVRTQQQLFDTRRQAVANELSILDESTRGLNQQLNGLQAQRTGQSQQLAILREEHASLKQLFEEGYVPRTRIFELERAIADTDARLAEVVASIGRIQAALSEARLRKVQREQEYDKDIETQLTQVQRDVDGLRQRQIALAEDLDRIEIRAPVAGVVVGMKVHSVGGVVRPGEDILEVVPAGEPLVVEVQIPVQSIELVEIGMDAMVRFSALSRLNPVVSGRVITVSADRLTDERSGMPYFKGRIEVPPAELDRLTYERIVPGMPAEVVIRTGEHSLLHYLLKPFLDHVFTAFRER